MEQAVTTPEPKKLSPEELAELHSLPDEAMVKPEEAAALLRLKRATLSWYRCHGGGPRYSRVGPNLIRYRMGDLREYAKGQLMSEGVRKVAAAARRHLLVLAQVVGTDMDVPHRHVACRVVEQVLQLKQRDAGLHDERRERVPQGVPRQAVQIVLRDLGDVPRLRLGGEQPRTLEVQARVLLDAVAEEVGERPGQRPVER